MSRFKVGIVGGAGYIGSALAHYLDEKFEVKVLDRSPLPRKLKSRDVEYQPCNIVKYEEVKRGLEDVDIVIHTAVVQIPQINEQKKLGYEVNLVGTQNICRAVNDTPSIRGVILTGTWHVFGEKDLNGEIDEEFGFRPDKVEERARLYVLSKIAQEVTLRMYDEFSRKIYGVIRLGTVLGEGMPEKTAANIFITRGLRGESITPYKHTMYRPMLYVDINDVCRMCGLYASKILNNKVKRNTNNLDHVINLFWPIPITIIELAHIIRDAVVKFSEGKIIPEIEIIDKELPIVYTPQSKNEIKVNIKKGQNLLNFKKLIDPQKSIERIIENRITASYYKV